MSKQLDKETERLYRAVTDPLIVYPPEDPAIIPKDLKAQITLERLVQAIKANCGSDIKEAADSEALLYLMTASLAVPFKAEWYKIYAHLFGQYAERRGLHLPDDLREDVERYRELNEHRLSQLKELKRWIQKQKDRAYKEIRPRSEKPERKPSQQLSLDLYADEFGGF